MKRLVSLILTLSVILMVCPFTLVSADTMSSGTVTDDFSMPIESNYNITESKGLQYNSFEKGYRAAYKSSLIGSAPQYVLPFMVVGAPVNTCISELRFTGKIAYWNSNIADFKFEQLNSDGQYEEITNFTVTEGEKSGNFTLKTYTVAVNNVRNVRITMPAKYGENYNAYMLSLEFDWTESNWQDITSGECVYDCTVSPEKVPYTQNHTELKQNWDKKSWMRSGDGVSESYFVIKAPVNTIITGVSANGTIYNSFNGSNEFLFSESDDCVNFTPLVMESDQPVSDGEYETKTYTISGMRGAKYVKIQLPVTPTEAWKSKLNSFSFKWETGDVKPAPIEYTSDADIKIDGKPIGDSFADSEGVLTADLTVTSTNPDAVDAKAYICLYEDGALSDIAFDNITINQGSNTYSVEGINKVKGIGDEIKIFVWSEMRPLTVAVCKTHVDPPVIEGESIKILAIGNSFSVDGMEYLYQIAKDAGIQQVVLGNLYIGGCSLEQHWGKANTDTASYTYYKNVSGEWTSSAPKTMLEGIQDENWDIITLQQASGSSGIPSTYTPYLENLIDYVNANKTNDNAKLGWHMTWAYQQDSTHAEFSKYDKSQETMYNAITSTVQNVVVPTDAFDFIIPSGTAIQNVRTSYIGDTLTRDGYHLSYGLGRYTAGMTWFKALTGKTIDNITFVPSSSDFTDEKIEIVKEAVNAACSNPFEVTKSSYESMGDINFDDYTLLEWTPTASSYWNSTESSSMKKGMNQYIATPMFNKYDLPDGSIIVIDEGYQYRPEGWINMDILNSSSSRPGNVTQNIVEVGAIWWGNFNYRAFNISVVGASEDLSDKVEEAASHFRIYIPKE